MIPLFPGILADVLKSFFALRSLRTGRSRELDRYYTGINLNAPNWKMKILKPTPCRALFRGLIDNLGLPYLGMEVAPTD